MVAPYANTILDGTCDLLEKLVAFRTVARTSNLELIDFCRDYLVRCGVESNLVVSENGEQANLYATIGPRVTGGVVLSGHVDVVTAEGQTWSSDPWRLSARDARLYGRGTCDMKGFVALVLAAVPLFTSARLERPVHIALSYDEEAGCIGGQALVEAMAPAIPRPSAVIVGEPTRHRVVNGHKSYTELETRIVGHAVHSSRSDIGASAVAAGARLITWLDDIDRANATAAEVRRNAFEPNYTTVHCGLMSGGTAATAVADRAVFTTDVRAVPWEDPRDYVERFRTQAGRAERDLKARHASGKVDIAIVTDIPGLSPEGIGNAEALALRLSSVRQTATVAYCTEAGLFQKAGWSTVVCGPGDILQAHRADEFIEVSQLVAGIEFMTRLRDSLIA